MEATVGQRTRSRTGKQREIVNLTKQAGSSAKKDVASVVHEASRSANREKILDAAEIEFSMHGYEACTLRMISDASGVNIGLIHYYFRTKERLFSAAFLRRSKILVERRMELLAEAKRQYKAQPIPLEKLVRCFITPTVEMIRLGAGSRAFIKLHARLRTEPIDFGRKLRGKAFNSVNNEFVKQLRRTCPHLDPGSVVWRLSAMIGACYSVISQSGQVHEMSKWKFCDPNDIDEAIAQVLSFVIAGFSAPEIVRAQSKIKKRPQKRG